MWGLLLFHWGANIHWGSLTGQMTSSWFDRGVIISSKAPPISTPFLFYTPPKTPWTDMKSPKYQITLTALYSFCNIFIWNLEKHTSYDVRLGGESGGLTPINSLINVSLHLSSTPHARRSLPPGEGRTCLFLSWDTGGRATVTVWLVASCERTADQHRLADERGICCASRFLFSCERHGVRFAWTREPCARAGELMRGYSWLMHLSKHLLEADSSTCCPQPRRN